MPISHCKLEVEIDDPKHVSIVNDPPPAPPLTVLAFSMQTLHNKKTHQNEV